MLLVLSGLSVIGLFAANNALGATCNVTDFKASSADSVSLVQQLAFASLVTRENYSQVQT